MCSLKVGGQNKERRKIYNISKIYWHLTSDCSSPHPIITPQLNYRLGPGSEFRAKMRSWLRHPITGLIPHRTPEPGHDTWFLWRLWHVHVSARRPWLVCWKYISHNGSSEMFAHTGMHFLPWEHRKSFYPPTRWLSVHNGLVCSTFPALHDVVMFSAAPSGRG